MIPKTRGTSVAKRNNHRQDTPERKASQASGILKRPERSKRAPSINGRIDAMILGTERNSRPKIMTIKPRKSSPLAEIPFRFSCQKRKRDYKQYAVALRYRHELKAVPDAAHGGYLGSGERVSSRHTACALMPSSSPSKPRRSVVVAFTDTLSTSVPITSAIHRHMSGM